MPPTLSPRSGRVARIALVVVLVGGALAAGRAQVPARAAGDPVLLAAGDVGTCDVTGALAGGSAGTAGLLNANPAATVAMLGDGAYDLSRTGTGADLTAYQHCYDPTWGQAGIKARTRPAPGDNDYEGSAQAADYFTYFNGAGPCSAPTSAPPDCPAGPNGLGYYSYDLGAWHIVVLNPQCDPTHGGPLGNTAVDGCGADSTMGRWLSADLAAHPTACTLAYWHEPRFFSFTSAGQTPLTGNTGYDTDPTMDAMWQILQDHKADVVLNGHRHVYERFPQQVLPTGSAGGPGVPDAAHGIREFVVGTGGGPHHHFDPDPRNDPSQTIYEPNSEVHIQQVFGVLSLTLHGGSYDWQYLAAGAKAAGTVLDSGSDACHAAGVTPSTTGPTTTTTTATGSGPAPTGPPTTQASSGYWMVDSSGTVYPFGAATGHGNAAPSPGATAAGLRPTPDGHGYWVVDSAGIVSARGDAPPLGSVAAGSLRPGEAVTSLSPTPSGRGYWLFTNRGRVFTFGDATGYGDMSKVTLNGPVLDSIPTPSGRGYYMVASDGGIFAFGDAHFAGSMGGKKLNAPVRSLVPNGDGSGYWLVASDGGVFAFNAPFRGSMGGTHLSKPVTGMVPYGNGYLMVGADGGIFDFSDRPFVGSLGSNPPAHPIVSVAAAP
ncbi:MAG TPA: hypothetical protein VGO87_11640 [Acidimicrobiia bacterium]